MRDIDLAYAAGIIDGEGCINIYKRHQCGRVYYHVRVVVVMTDPEAVEFLRQTFGGVVRDDRVLPSGKQVLRWDLYSKKADEFLRAVLPHLRVKRDQAELAIEFRDTLCKVRGVERTVEQVTAQEFAFHKIRELKNCTKGVVKT